MPFTDYGASKLFGYVFSGDDGSGELPVTLYCALFSTATGNDGSGTELSGDNYSRFLAGDWVDSGTGRGLTNDADIESTVASADWDAVTHIAFFDDPTAGNMWYHLPLGGSVSVLIDQYMNFAAGAIVLELDT